MPIKDKKAYPKNWKEIVEEIRARANYCCECPGLCGDHPTMCLEVHGQYAITFRGSVILTTAHLCFTPSCDDRRHLLSMCQKCHNRYDNSHRQRNAAITRANKKLIK